MSFCPYCGTSIESAAESKAQCPACGRVLTGPGTLVASAAPGKPSRKQPRSFLKDAVIALAIFVLLISLWRLMTRTQPLQNDHFSSIRTNIFGPLGTHLVQTIGESLTGYGSSPESPPTSLSSNAGAWSSNLSISEANPVGSGTNPVRMPGDSLLTDDTLISNRPVKVMVDSPTDFSFTNLPVGGSSNSPDAASLARRLGEVGAKGGDIQLSLSWNNVNDLDLHCIDPRGIEIWYSNTNSAQTGGQLDHDANAGGSYTSSPVENIFWPIGGAPAGFYQVSVVYYAQHGGPDPTRFTVRTLVKGQTNYFTSALSYTGQKEKHWICTFKFDPANPDPAKRRLFLNNFQTRANSQ